MDSVNAALRFQTGEPGFPNAPQTGKPASCFDMLQKGELQGSSALAADWSSISRNELSLIQAALQRAEHPGLPLGDSSLIAAQQFPSDLEPALTAAHPGLPLGGSALTAMAQRQGLGDTEPALIAGQAARQQRVKERESSAAETAPSAALFEAPQKPSAALLQDGYGALGQLSPTTPLLVQISNETCGSSLSPLPSPLNTSLPPPACRTFTLPSLPPVLHPSTALRARCSPGFVPSGFVPSFGTKRRLLAAQIHDLADMEALQVRKRLRDAGMCRTRLSMSPTHSGLDATHPDTLPTRAGVSPTRAGVSPTRAGVSPTCAGVSPTCAGVSPTRAGVCLPQHPLDQLAAALVKPPHPFKRESGVGLDGCVDSFPRAAAAIDDDAAAGAGGAPVGGDAVAAAASAPAAPAMPTSSLAHQQRQAAISSLFRRLQAQSPGSTALHRSVSSELRFEPSQGLSQPQQHPRSSTSLMQPSVQPAAVQPGSFQAHAHKPFPPKSSGLLPCTQQPFSPDSPQIQAAAAAFRSPSAAPRESTPGGNTGFKSPSATPSPLSQSPRAGVGRARAVAAAVGGAGARQITGKSATEKQRRSRITERLEALKAAIPAEVLLRQQGRTGFSNRTQIATLLDAAVGFIEGMREYKLELERQLLAS
ncbi:unnamed protein product [Closterium sp. NIES-64]|nr:unnamed protein product [Closterium sp. NIES-64]